MSVRRAFNVINFTVWLFYLGLLDILIADICWYKPHCDYLSRMITITLFLNLLLPYSDVTTYDTNYICPENCPDHCEKEPFY